jgi:hypothetical protein
MYQGLKTKDDEVVRDGEKVVARMTMLDAAMLDELKDPKKKAHSEMCAHVSDGWKPKPVTATASGSLPPISGKAEAHSAMSKRVADAWRGR